VSPSAADPLLGRCGCGAVRFEVRAPFRSARYCHCHRCQQRTGTSCSANARIAREHFEVLTGAALIRSWQPAGGAAKSYCVECGGHVFSESPEADFVSVRLGAIVGDPGIRPSVRQWVSSAASWEDIPDDGLPRYDEEAP
jgi:hypothetical protein